MQYAGISWFKQQMIISKSDLLGQCKHIVHNEEALAADAAWPQNSSFAH